MDNEMLMEIKELLERLVIAVENLNLSSTWNADTIISLFALIGAWFTIILLLIERHERNRPYLQISFELVRSTLACIVLRNTGTCPLKIKSLEFNTDFITQLPLEVQERLNKKKNTDISIFPNRQWVFSFDVNVFEIINKYAKKQVKINYKYNAIGKCKRVYSEETIIDFEEYSGILDYISDLDEFKNSVDRLNKSVSNFIDVSKIEDDTVKRINK